jgi:ligand-binding sensor domain-containing protein/two-component sensor histidine kinase
MRCQYAAIFFLFSCLVLSTILTAQPMPYFVEKLTTEEGLGSNKVNDIAQDANGFLWIATSDGLNRFDGTEVVRYYHQDHTNSLPHNYVYCLKPLPGNYLAIGTQGGLSFYNSITGIFRNYYYRQNNSLDEFNNVISSLETDDKGNLWAYSRNSIFIFDQSLELKKIISSPFTETDLAKGRLRYIERVFPLSHGNALMYLNNSWQIYSTSTYRMTSLKNSSFFNKLKFLNDECPASLAGKFQQYFPASNLFKVFGSYLLYIKPCTDSLFLFNDDGLLVSSCFFSFNRYPYILWSQQVSTLDSSTLLFSFHNYGVATVSITWQNNTPVIHSPSATLFEENEYGTALRDRQGNLWLATTEDGLQKISPDKQRFKGNILVNRDSGKQIKYDVNSAERYDNILWITTYGEGFFEFDLLSGRQQQHHLAKTINDSWANFIWNIRRASPDTLWIGTQAGMLWYCISKKTSGRILAYPGKPPALDSVAITMQFEDSHGLIWMGLGKGNGLCYFDSRKHRFNWYPANTTHGYPSRYPIAVAEDKKANLWFVNDGSTALTYWNRDIDQFMTIPLSPPSQKLTGNLHTLLYEDSVLWLGTVTGGLAKYHIATNSIQLYGHDRGLVNSNISQIYKDHKKRLWLNTDGGLSCFDPRTESFTNYTSKEGLPAKYPSASFFYDEQQKRLYNGGPGVFFYFDPDSLNFNQPPGKTIITAMQVNGRPYMYTGQPAKFSPKQNDITIHYAAIDMMNGPATKYTYRLVGEDTGWITAGNQRQINFSHLAPGKYTFMVRASNRDGEWDNQPASISFSIRPPFTQTVWFYALVLLVMGSIFYALYRFRLRQVMRTEQVRSEISKNLHDEVGSALTNISLSTLLAQKQITKQDSVKRILERIYQDSQSISEALREIVWSIDPKIDTAGEAFPRMLRYASELLEAKNMELRAEFSPGIEDLKLSMEQRRDLYLIFKEAVNNLAKYSNATQVMINFHIVDNTLVMRVADNGTGFDTNVPYTSNGLKNMQERAHSHRWKLTIESGPGKGTTITVKTRIA